MSKPIDHIPYSSTNKYEHFFLYRFHLHLESFHSSKQHTNTCARAIEHFEYKITFSVHVCEGAYLFVCVMRQEFHRFLQICAFFIFFPLALNWTTLFYHARTFFFLDVNQPELMHRLELKGKKGYTHYKNEIKRDLCICKTWLAFVRIYTNNETCAERRRCACARVLGEFYNLYYS